MVRSQLCIHLGLTHTKELLMATCGESAAPEAPASRFRRVG
jgi:hypothetical protein